MSLKASKVNSQKKNSITKLNPCWRLEMTLTATFEKLLTSSKLYRLNALLMLQRLQIFNAGKLIEFLMKNAWRGIS